MIEREYGGFVDGAFLDGIENGLERVEFGDLGGESRGGDLSYSFKEHEESHP